MPDEGVSGDVMLAWNVVCRVQKLITENVELEIRWLERAVCRSRADHMVVVILKVIYKECVSCINVTVRNDFVLNLSAVLQNNELIPLPLLPKCQSRRIALLSPSES